MPANDFKAYFSSVASLTYILMKVCVLSSWFAYIFMKVHAYFWKCKASSMLTYTLRKVYGSWPLFYTAWVEFKKHLDVSINVIMIIKAMRVTDEGPGMRTRHSYTSLPKREGKKDGDREGRMGMVVLLPWKPFSGHFPGFVMISHLPLKEEESEVTPSISTCNTHYAQQSFTANPRRDTRINHTA